MKEFLFSDNNWDLYEYLYGENPVRCFFDGKLRNDPNGFAKYPYYQLRGKPVTPEQAMEIIIRTESLWREDSLDEKAFPEYVPCDLIDNSYYDLSFSWRAGWVHPNGIIGQNSHCGYKYPLIDEIFKSFVPVASAFPYLDFFVGVSWFNENIPEKEDWYLPEWENYQKNGFGTVINYGIRVRDKTIEIFDKDDAIDLYEEYERLYEVPDKALYEEGYYTGSKPLDWEYLVEAVRLVKLPNAEEFLEKYAEKLEEKVSRISDPYKYADNDKFLFEDWQLNLLASKHEYDLKNQKGD